LPFALGGGSTSANGVLWQFQTVWGCLQIPSAQQSISFPLAIFNFHVLRSIYIKLFYTTNAFWWSEFEHEKSKQRQLTTAKPVRIEGSAPNVYGCS
jgi:hypothetical protein